MNKDTAPSFKDTLNLPQTDLSIKNNHKVRDEELINIWKSGDIYQKQFLNNPNGEKRFVFHWGPPYTNGHIHMGHVLSETLDDIVVKQKQKSGYKVHFKLGWDCHGMPIEVKVAANLGLSKDEIAKDPVAFKKECRKYAQEWIEVQREEFRRLGYIGDFENYYSTMSPKYEAKTLESLGMLVDKGFIRQRHKTISWCTDCATALASAEIEYKDRKDPSIFVKFELTDESKLQLHEKLGKEFDASKNVSCLVWTTTPWTLPLNRALILHPEAQYSLVEVDGEYLILAAGLVEKLAAKFKKDLNVVKIFAALPNLEGFTAKHILTPGKTVPFVFEKEMVSLDDGTAIIHCAPGAGPEDYLIGLKYDLEVYSPVTPDGHYSGEMDLPDLVGVSLKDALGKVLSKLLDAGSLFHKESINHSYAHCWRCKNGLIYRATKQWFCNLAHDGLQQKALDAVQKIDFVPAWGKTRFESFIGNRAEWCISRQRFWGVPIVAVKCADCGEGVTNKTLVDFVASKVEVEGIEYWDGVTVEQLRDAGLVEPNSPCSVCNSSAEKILERDILDVWFDSGTSHTAVLKAESEDLYPADMILEGSDQHRGWFQSSVLTSVAMYGKPSMKKIVTHGYILDANREKMSKSQGNVLAPQSLIDLYGADVIRCWVASSDFVNDVTISTDIFKNCAEMVRKIRNTCRFMLSNIFDVDRKVLLSRNYLQTYDWSEIGLLDRSILVKLVELVKKVDVAYEKLEFTTVMREINAFCTSELSAGYFDMVRETLYVDRPGSKIRHSVQMTFVVLMDFLLHRISPILCFMAEDVYGYFAQDSKSIWEVAQPDVSDLESLLQKCSVGLDEDLFEKSINILGTIRKSSFEKIERLREEGVVKNQLGAKVVVGLVNNSGPANILLAFFQALENKEPRDHFLKRWLGVSQVELAFVDQPKQDASFVVYSQVRDLTNVVAEQIKVEAFVAQGQKCPRCWQIQFGDRDQGLCEKCFEIVG